MSWIEIAAVAMVVAVVASHTGFATEAWKVAGKVVRCVRCTSFWLVLISLCLYGCPPPVAVVLSFVCSYLALWIDLLMGAAALKYERL